MRSKALERLSRALITLLGAGLGAALAMLLTPLLRRVSPQIFEQFSNQVLLYVVLCLLGALIFFALSMSILTRCMKAAAVIEQHWEKMPNRQIVWTSLGLLCGLAIAALFTQLILSAGASLLTLSFSALTYIFLGYLGLQIGNHRYHSGKHLPSLRRRKRHTDGEESLLDTVLSEVSEDGDEGEDDLSAGEESAFELKRMLKARELRADERRRGETEFYVSDRVEDFEQTASLFLQEDLRHMARRVDIERY